MSMLTFLGSVVLVALCFVWGTRAATNVSFDGRAFLIDGERTLIISGSVHYPRASAAEWPNIIQKAKDNGINMIETYVFWDLHEPKEGEYYFPNDGSNADLISFLKECQKQGMFVNVRFGPYVCAEWNYGGFPAWLREIEDITFRTMNIPFIDRAMAFVQKSISVIQEAGMFATSDGPVIMVQIENEYGNMEHYYGDAGAKYVQLNAEFAKSFNLGIPWMMCQQGEGTGTAPPAEIINTCNGYYCDNWIEKHAESFPNQPHMWTENWPGWFQTWGQAVPHRPTVDVTFAIARWFAKGGSFMNYYMAFGGSTFGRHSGGPLIITSYDYDVQINEYGLEAEPKFSATKNLHRALFEVSDVILSVDQIPLAVSVSSDCESHEYRSSDPALGCMSFLSNFGTKESCSFNVSNGRLAFDVPMWSVSIVKNTCSDSSDPVLLLNTRDDAISIDSNMLVLNTIMSFENEKLKSFQEPVPGSTSDPQYVFTSEKPLEQLSLTLDQTDYLWYSTVLKDVPEGTSSVKLRYTSGVLGGSHVYAFINGQLVYTAGLSEESSSSADIASVSIGIPVSITAPVSFGDNRLDLVTVSMGLQNYGPYLEKRKVGIISDIMAQYSEDSEPIALENFTHVVGLSGEKLALWNTDETDPSWKDVNEDDAISAKPFTWYRIDFVAPPSADDNPIAINIFNPESKKSLGKGAIWVNGFMLGRFWDVVARSQPACQVCESDSYTGPYNSDSCRSGCNQLSQSLYKIPKGVLHSAGSGLRNSLVLLRETAAEVSPRDVLSLVSVSMGPTVLSN